MEHNPAHLQAEVDIPPLLGRIVMFQSREV